MPDNARNPRVRSLTVIDVVDETPDAKSIVFGIPSAERDRFAYQPGQFLTLRIPSERTGSVARCYSLASSPDTDDHLIVTVKRTADGYGSNWLCDNLKPGAVLDVLPPSGHFTPTSLDTDMVLFAGGSGITPIFSILRSALTNGRARITLLYANRDERSVIFAERLRELAEKYPERLTVLHWLESLQGHPQPGIIRALAAQHQERHAFICGPAPFMRAVSDTLAASGMPHERIHMEIYSSLSGNPFDDEAAPVATAEADTPTVPATIELDGDVHHIDWPVTVPLVDALLARGIEAPYMCRDGECGACQATVTCGAVRMLRNDLLGEDDITDGYVLTCQAVPDGDSEIHIAY